MGKRSNVLLAIPLLILAAQAQAQPHAQPPARAQPHAQAQEAQGRFTPGELTKRSLERRAVEGAIWGMPIVSFDVMRHAFFRDAKAHDGDILYWSSGSTWKNQTVTPDPSVRYVILFTNTKDGPVVVDVPPAGDAALAGTLLDAWQRPLAEVGNSGEEPESGGKYLLLPPRYKGETPSDYVAVPSNTYNGFVVLRLVPKTEQADDVRSAIEFLKKLRTYPLAAATAPPEQRYIDMADRRWDGIVRFDESFYRDLAEMVNEELAQARDLEMLGLLRSLGIEKGKKFKPDAATRAILKDAGAEAHAWFVERLVTYGQRFWPDRRWDLPAPLIASETGFKWEAADYFDVDARGIGLFASYAPSAQSAAVIGLETFLDARGERLGGESDYRLHVPAEVPARQFWTFTVYDHATAGFIPRAARATLDSRDERLQRNADGSVDIAIGPKPPKGRETNWIPTVAGKGWFPYFRFYGADDPLVQKTWELPDITKVK